MARMTAHRHDARMRPGTAAVWGAKGAEVQGEPLMAGATFAGTYRHAGDPGDGARTYGRYDNPTWAAYEQALAVLEGGDCVCFASGMAAAVAAFGTLLGAGSTLLLPADGYYTVRQYALDRLPATGVQVRTYRSGAVPDFVRGAVPDFARGAVLWAETPTNPGLDAVDIEALARAAHDAGGLLVVDNTTATPLGQQVLSLGADVVVSSDSKALTGHSDLIIGHVACRDPRLAAQLTAWRSQTGSVPGPMETWLALRSLPTLELRLARQSANALALAEALSAHPAVGSCRYPGLPSDPSHAIASRQMRHFGAVLNFTLADQNAAESWLRRLRLVAPATSFGGVHSTAERRARWGGDEVPPGFVRLSAGVEDIEDLRRDILDALDAGAD